uniref:NADH-ubiquinone oxidoreductase chain 3 n=1 Tax=Crassostrea virginica TaxID=6565 RepID=Q4KRY4_CRAVI|nr:NADH dehydrogenase subunit 3 [Crassostrea virginica]
MGFEVMSFIILVSAAPVAVSSVLVNMGESQHDWDKSAPYECGFIGATNPGDFSSRFFHLVILFLVWDVEIVLLIPCFQDLTVWSSSGGALAVFLLVLSYGLYYEIFEGSVKWTLQEE